MIVGLKVTDASGNWRAITVTMPDDASAGAERALHYVRLLSFSAIDHGIELGREPNWEWITDDVEATDG